MKQRPVFILLTFFLALASVVMITFVFLRTQLNEQKLQTIVEDTIHKNFNDFKVTMDQIGLSLGTKFRYKIAKIKIEYRSPDGIFKYVEMNNISIKFPLFFLLGKQDIDISIAEIKLDGIDYNKWIKNNYKLTSLELDKLTLPRFLIDNRINLTVDQFNVQNSLGVWPSPMSFTSIHNIVVKNLSLTEKSAVEFDSVVQLSENKDEKIEANLFAIGDIMLGQFVSNSAADSKILFEVKSVNKPVLAWLTGHRLQLLRDSQLNKTFVLLHGNSLEGKMEMVVNTGSMVFREIEIDLKLEDIVRDSSILKNSVFVVTSALNINSNKNIKISINGNLSFLPESNNWITHLGAKFNDNNMNVIFELESEKSQYVYNIKSGDDLSYRKITFDCLKIYCLGDNISMVEINFYNQILSDDQLLSLSDVLTSFSKWWSSISPLLPESKSTPLKVYLRKNRWSDFEFDLYSDVSMAKNVFATENFKVKSRGKDIIDAKISFAAENTKGIVTRLIATLNNFPSSVLTKLAHETQVQLTGSASGLLAAEFTANEKKYSADLKLVDGAITWLNFDDLFRQKLFVKPVDEIKFSNLNWVEQFKSAEFTLQWTEQSKVISWELMQPKNVRKLIKLGFDTGTNDVTADVNYFTVSQAEKKYLMTHHNGTSFNFKMSYLPNELKLQDVQTSSIESVPQE